MNALCSLYSCCSDANQIEIRAKATTWPKKTHDSSRFFSRVPSCSFFSFCLHLVALYKKNTLITITKQKCFSSEHFSFGSFVRSCHLYCMYGWNKYDAPSFLFWRVTSIVHVIFFIGEGRGGNIDTREFWRIVLCNSLDIPSSTWSHFTITNLWVCVWYDTTNTTFISALKVLLKTVK